MIIICWLQFLRRIVLFLQLGFLCCIIWFSGKSSCPKRYSRTYLTKHRKSFCLSSQMQPFRYFCSKIHKTSSLFQSILFPAPLPSVGWLMFISWTWIRPDYSGKELSSSVWIKPLKLFGESRYWINDVFCVFHL